MQARLAVLLACTSLTLPGGNAVSQPLADVEVKAAFVVNFVRFTEWPASALGPHTKQLGLCLAGEREGFLEASARLDGKTVHNREMRVRTISRPADLGGCHIVLYGSGPRRAEMLAAAARLPVLTISDLPEFAAASGGMIELAVQQDRVVFDINLDALRGAGLRMSSQVLRLARKVTDSQGRDAR